MKINEYQNRNKKAFTLVEIMLLLVVLSLIMASSVSVITRKHKVKPRRAVHGQYICFYDQHRDASGSMVYDGKHEILMSGNTIVKNSANVAQCSFKIPSTASYIHVRLMGGGGAGGNANYYPNKHLKTETKPINLVKTYTEGASSYNDYVLPKVTDGNVSNDNSNTYGSSYAMGISRSYVNNKFPKDPVSGCNSDDCTLFPSTLFNYLVNKYVIDRSFAYDYAGDGESGNGIKYNAFTDALGCPGHTDFGTCLENFVKGYTVSGTTYPPFNKSNLSMECLTYKNSDGTNVDANTFKNYCPLFFAKFYVPYLSMHSCGGGTGGKGSLIVAEREGYDFHTFPVLGWRWPNYNSTSLSLSELCDDELKNYRVNDDSYSTNSKSYLHVIDRLGCSYAETNTYIPEYNYGSSYAPDESSVVPAEAEISTNTPCPGVEIGGKCYKVATNNGYVADSPTALVKIPKLTKNAEFRPNKWHLSASLVEYNVGPYNGSYPYYSRHPVKSDATADLDKYAGVKLHFGEGSSSSNIVKNWNVFDTTKTTVLEPGGNPPPGTAGGSMSVADMNLVWTDTGKDAGCPASSYTEGKNGTSHFKPSLWDSLLCINHLGFLLKNDDIRNNVLNAYSYACPTGNSYAGPTNHIPAAEPLDEGQIALELTLYYYDKAISYGAPGEAGGYLEFFTRSYRSNTVYVSPGTGGVARPVPTKAQLSNISAYANQAPGTAQHGKSSHLYYNCDASIKNCARKTAGGGLGGVSGIWESAEQLKYTGAEIKQTIDDLKTAGNQFIKCSYSAPAEEGCPSTSANEVFKGEVSPFAQVAPLLNLPGGLSLNLERLGSGGDGGWVVDKCWVLPQYFMIREGSYMDSSSTIFNTITLEDGSSLGNVLQNITTDGLGDAPKYYGYTNLSQDDVNQCTVNNKFPSGDSYKETPGTDGMPGAVVITW